MFKQTFFLISFILLLGLSVGARAEPLDVNNFSFELNADGNQILGHTGMAKGDWPDVGVLGWTNVGDFVGVDVECCDACDTPEHCFGADSMDDCLAGNQDDHATDGIAVCYFQTNDLYFYQVLDHSIGPNKRYTLTFDAMSEQNVTVVPSFFYPEDGNNPGENHIEIISKEIWLAPEGYPDDVDANTVGFDYDPTTLNRTLSLVVLPDANCVGKRLGIKFYSPIPDDEDDWQWGFIDNIRVDCVWASGAWGPKPADEAENVVRSTVLSWIPGLWAADTNGHDVYFGTNFNDVNDANTTAYNPNNVYMGRQDANDFNDFVPSLELAKTYYWRVDEVNGAYVGTEPPTPAHGRWKGPVWSFSTNDGKAFDPSPANGRDRVFRDVPLEVVLSWTAGIDASSHDVYFGTSSDEVSDANTATAVIYRGNQALSNVNCAVPGAEVELGQTYYWRVDEVNASGIVEWPGRVWMFTINDYLIVDDFDSYVSDEAIKAVWKDYWADTASKNGAEVFTEMDPAFTRERRGRSMRYTYVNNKDHKVGGKFVGSEAEREYASPGDWTAGGVKAFTLYFYGDPCNGLDTTSLTTDQMYVALEDESSNDGIVLYPDMNAVREAYWHEWNIDFQDPCLTDVNMSNVAKVYIGFGGQKTGQSEPGAGMDYGYSDTVYFDDIRLYPPRCVPTYAHTKGSFDGDCVVGYTDVAAMGRDWLMSGGWVEAGPPDANFLEVWFEFEDEFGITASDSSGNNRDGTLIDMDPVYDWVTGYVGDALQFDGVDDYVEFPALNLNSDTVTMSAWIEPNGLQPIFAGIVFCRHDANDDGGYEEPEDTVAGLCFSYGGGWVRNNELGYNWNDEWWSWHSGLIVPDKQWSFVAIVVEPTQATLYLYENEALSEEINAKAHDIEQFGDVGTIAYDNSLGTANPRDKFNGKIDDVRIYNKALTRDEILYLAQGPGLIYVPLASWRADADGSDKVDFRDYAIMANNWLEEFLWPEP